MFGSNLYGSLEGLSRGKYCESVFSDSTYAEFRL